MNKPFPLEIKPCPIVTATIELRFISELKDAETLSFFYKNFSSILPEIKGNPLANLPQIKMIDPNLKYLTDYVLANENYSMGIAKNVITFNIINEYPLWGNYFNFIKECLKKLANSEKIKKIERIGLRYINLFQNESKISNFLDSAISMPYKNHDYTIESEKLNVTLKKNETKIRIQIAENAQIKRFNTTLKGTLLDIDSYQSDNLPHTITNSVIDIIDNLHTEEKNIFFLSLNEEYAKQHFSIR